MRYFLEAGYRLLALTAARRSRLPLLHDDPSDRLLVAQAFAEPMRLLTHDRQIAAYCDGVTRV